MVRCCIFDLDGTLLNTLKALTYTTNLVMEHFGYEMLSEEKIKRFVGDGAAKLIERSLIDAGDVELVHFEEAMQLYQKLFAKHCLYEVKPYAGICELLETLKAHGIRIAVLSNKPHARTVENIEMIFGAGYFDFVAGERAGIPRKPDPKGVLEILHQFGVTPEECFYFGDTNTDMQTGLSAGVITVGVTWGFRERAELEAFHPQYVIDHPEEVLEYLFSV